MNRDEEIFADALELPEAEQAAYLDRACAGDPALRVRVAALLAGYRAADDFLEHSPVARPTATRPEEKPGDALGRYTLIRKLGDGGCGVVYLAEQREPVRRQVALKVIKLGMDTRQVIARFEAERQALAMMDHPDIARVFDAGTTDAGRPYFVMEYVDGQPITKYCDEHSLPMTARLELFARVCLALQHAHQKGIVHRDVKPSNILVATHDGVPVPKIIDFGIAKATQGRLTEQTLYTGLDQFIGTPAYMSPEQAELRDLDIDTRSDVYALGVLLYELLTGRPPYDPKSLIQAGVAEIRRIIREVDPPRPSTRLATLADADRTTVARLRRAAPMQLSSLLRGDLDWIVMRCLEKDRDRRYSTAHELAADVRRHLRQEPVVARPPSAAYRIRKFLARHRLACASALALALALITGTVVSVRQAVRATRAEQVARAERDVATAATRAEALARADAQRRQEQAEELLTFMLGDFRTELQKIGRLNLLDAVGEKALAHFAALEPGDLTDTALTRQAQALTQIGEIRLDQARYPEAAAAFNTAYTRAAALATRHPQNPAMLFERAQAEFWIGYVAGQRRDAAEERAWFTRYRDSALALLALEGPTPRARLEVIHGHHNLATLELAQDNLDAAQAGFITEQAAVEALLAASPADTELQSKLADLASWLGTIAERDGRYPEAIQQFERMTARLEKLHAQEPDVARWREELAQSLALRADIQMIAQRRTEAAKTYAQAETLADALIATDPTNRAWQIFRQRLALAQIARLVAEGQLGPAGELARLTRARLTELVTGESIPREFTRTLASAWRWEARCLLETDHPAAAQAVTQALALVEPLLSDPRVDHRTLWEGAQAQLLAGRLHAAQGRNEEARRHWTRASGILAPRLPHTNDWRVLDPAIQALRLCGQPQDAAPLRQRLRQFGYHPLDPLAAFIPEATD